MITNVNKIKFGYLKVLYPTEEWRKSHFDFCEPFFKKILVLTVSKKTIYSSGSFIVKTYE